MPKKIAKNAATSPSDLILYNYWRSSCSWRVRWALALKGVAFRNVPIDLLHDGQKSPDFLSLNPAGFVPAMVIDGVAYGESLALLEWIEETWPNPSLLPLDPVSRLRVRQLCLTIVAGTQPLQNLVAMRAHSTDGAEQSRWARTWIQRGLQTFEALAQLNYVAGTFSFGGTLTMADLCVVPQVYNAKRFGVDLSEMPIVSRIYDHCLTLSACTEAAPQNQPGAQLLAGK